MSETGKSDRFSVTYWAEQWKYTYYFDHLYRAREYAERVVRLYGLSGAGIPQVRRVLSDGTVIGGAA